ncbi:uncharacterized protein CTHT_0067560 [Thermochaetoides thermophila DSM 1495]|uniref:Heterokaryon incompatibility domain-containing protein n=1 Tax=Chaetomium thermophilum (strain DSM 1495 / CBS 144.50 / IMI 039719) TaxID=759272 RepID=G0SGU1_CHATD|nr:hypothetical protein CTHT_0067560 [Thermochaetoides thermophila DSM 1495]EGS17430.1 hypothetical protein CTHT_0067560 [Thermochaetoides thermophila DSM 1495]
MVRVSIYALISVISFAAFGAGSGRKEGSDTWQPVGGYPRSNGNDSNSNSSTSSELIGILLWIDTLSINQADMSERNSQVLLMGEVYRNATSVLSWLGEHPLLSRALKCPASKIDSRTRNDLREKLGREWLESTKKMWQDDKNLESIVKFVEEEY